MTGDTIRKLMQKVVTKRGVQITLYNGTVQKESHINNSSA